MAGKGKGFPTSRVILSQIITVVLLVEDRFSSWYVQDLPDVSACHDFGDQKCCTHVISETNLRDFLATREFTSTSDVLLAFAAQLCRPGLTSSILLGLSPHNLLRKSKLYQVYDQAARLP